MKNIIFILMLSVICFAGCSININTVKEFIYGDLSITLNSTFVETEVEGVDYALASPTFIVTISKNVNGSQCSLEDFIEIFKEDFAIDVDFNMTTLIGSATNFYYANYENETSDGITYAYLTSIYKYQDEFYCVDIICEQKNISDEVTAQLFNWVTGVTFESEKS